MKTVELIREKDYRGYGIELRPVTPCDLPSLRRWRNNPKISATMCDQSYISADKQTRWYKRLKERTDQAHWVVWCKGTRTGYINIKETAPAGQAATLDVGMYAGNSPVRHALLGFAMGLLQLDLVFEVLSAPRIEMTVKETNANVLRFNRELGYRETDRKDGFVHLAMTPAEYKMAKARLLRFFPRA